jgi:hypothetical protein
MNITLYSCTCSNETVDKTNYLTSIDTLSGEFRGEINILRPVIRVAPTTAATQTKILTQCNYVYIAALGRYYFVTDITGVANNLIEISLRVDVLFSWKTAILAQSVIVSRNENEYALYLDDSVLKVYNNPNITVYHFKDTDGVTDMKFSDSEFILALAGS